MTQLIQSFISALQTLFLIQTLKVVADCTSSSLYTYTNCAYASSIFQECLCTTNNNRVQERKLYLVSRKLGSLRTFKIGKYSSLIDLHICAKIYGWCFGPKVQRMQQLQFQ